jgi:transposase
MKKQRKHYTPEEKVAILRRHLVEGVPISDLCDERGHQPTVFYRWQKEFFENGAAVFQQGDGPSISLNRNESPIWSRRSKRKMKCWPN